MPNQKHSSVQLFLILISIISTTAAVVLLVGQMPAYAEEPYSAGSADIVVTTLEINSGREVLALIDRENRTICVYQYFTSRPAHERFALVAARSFRYDSMLEDYNNADPSPEKVRQWILRSQQVETAIPARPATPAAEEKDKSPGTEAEPVKPNAQQK